jgi:hypothetical protein
MDKDKWEEFKTKVDLYTENRTNTNIELITCTQTLNQQWHKLSTAIRKAANETIPTTKITSHTHLAFTKKATQLHMALKNINKSLYIAISARPPTLAQQIITQINHLLEKIHSLSNIPITNLNKDSLNYINFSNTINQLHTARNTLYNARNIENQAAQRD